MLVACGGSSSSNLFGAGADAGDEASVAIDGGGAEGGAGGDAGACAPGFADCDGDPQNGCETNIAADEGNCGGCGRAHACASGQSCQSGACVAGPATVVPGGTLQTGDNPCLALDGASVYVTSGRPGGDVYRVAKGGGSPASIATGQAGPRGVATDGTHVFWANTGGGTIVRANPDGSSPQTIYTGPPGVSSIALDSQAVYFTNFAQGFLGRVDKDGQNPRQLHPVAGSPGQGHAVSVDVTGGFAFFTDGQAGQLIKVASNSVTGGVPIATGFNNARGVGADANTVYFTAAGAGGQVLSVPASASSVTVPTQVAPNQSGASYVVSDRQSVYWSNSIPNGAIMKLAPNGNVAPLATGQAAPQCLAVDATSVYWINAQGASVMRVAK